VGLAPLRLNGEARRSLYREVERDGRWGRWMLKKGDPLPPNHPGLEMVMGPVSGDQEGWLGVEPGVQMNFEVLDINGSLGPIAES